MHYQRDLADRIKAGKHLRLLGWIYTLGGAAVFSVCANLLWFGMRGNFVAVVFLASVGSWGFVVAAIGTRHTVNAKVMLSQLGGADS